MMVQEGIRGRRVSSVSLDAFSSSKRDVNYCCGSCGYSLNLSSSCRNTANIGSKYKRSIKKGIVSFYSIDESRYSLIDEVICSPYFSSMHSWGLFRRRTKLGCRQCGSYIGSTYEETLYLPSFESDYCDSISSPGDGHKKKYKIRISALQPSLEESGAALVTQ